MNHYVDIHLREDPEFAAHQLMEALYAKLHRALVARAAQGAGGDLGVSFPGHKPDAPYLGSHLRLHGNEASLSALLATDWLRGMRDHLDLSAPAPVPLDATHRAVQRQQVDSNPERLRRRLLRRHPLTEQEAQARIPDKAARRLDLPFVQLKSTSTGQTYKLFIRHGPPQSTPVPGPFNTYGLSLGATVPWF
jgi:CRISPR-associated endonuclease Csy4